MKHDEAKSEEQRAKSLNLTNHGAELDGVPLNQRWRETPVRIREDIAQHGQRVKYGERVEGIDLLAKAMLCLSLGSARFGGIGDESKMVDQLVKGCVKRHHESWIMEPLTLLYDEMRADEALSSPSQGLLVSQSGKGVAA